MNYKDSDGYILIDMSIADISKSTQSIQGIYDRIVSVLDTNKLVLVINFGEYSPMPAIARKKLNYYVITTNLFIITINSNDVVIIEEAGESTVDVSIVPTYIEGTKIADYTIGEQKGAIYIPEVQSEINDNVTASNTTWSSDKISDELALKATTASLSDVAFTGSYDDLIGKPTIPDELNDLDDVTLTSPSNGQTLVFDATEGKFINQTPPSGVTTLAGLSDVDITSPEAGNIFSFDGTNWTNETITAAGIEYSSGVSVADKIDDIEDKVIYDTFTDNIAISTAFGVCFRSGFMTVDLTSYGLTRKPKIFIQALSNQLYPIGVMLLETSISTTSFQFALVSPQQEGTAKDFMINLMIVK